MTVWYLLLSLVFVIANGLFVAAEFAIVKVRPTQLAELTAQGSSRARMARRIVKKLDSYLSATQLGVTLASLALGWVGEPAFADLLIPHLAALGVSSTAVAHSIAASVAFIFALHIIFGELGPKYIAIDKPLATALWLAHILRGFYVAMFPIIWVLNHSSNAILKVVG